MENSFMLPCCAAVLSGFAAGQLCVFILNVIPSKWLCDYGEAPGKELSLKRFSAKKHGLISGCVLAAAFTVFYLNYDSKPAIFLYCLVSLVLVMSAVTDIKYRIIPDQFSVFIAIAGIIYYIYCFTSTACPFDKIGPFIGAICGGGLWILLGIIGKAIYHEESIGFGDVKLFAATGFLLSIPSVFTAFFLTIVAAGIVFAIMLLLKKIDGKSYMPMAPYICAACITVLAFKEHILSFILWYISLIK